MCVGGVGGAYYLLLYSWLVMACMSYSYSIIANKNWLSFSQANQPLNLLIISLW